MVRGFLASLALGGSGVEIVQGFIDTDVIQSTSAARVPGRPSILLLSYCMLLCDVVPMHICIRIFRSIYLFFHFFYVLSGPCLTHLKRSRPTSSRTCYSRVDKREPFLDTRGHVPRTISRHSWASAAYCMTVDYWRARCSALVAGMCNDHPNPTFVVGGTARSIATAGVLSNTTLPRAK